MISKKQGIDTITKALAHYGISGVPIKYTEEEDTTDAMFEAGDKFHIQVCPYAFPQVYSVGEYFYGSDGHLSGAQHHGTHTTFIGAAKELAVRYLRTT